jgi:hypothetical protein
MANYPGLAGAAARSSAGGKNHLTRLGHLLTRREIGHVTRVRDRCNSLWFSAMQGPWNPIARTERDDVHDVPCAN